jgi:hypothetical protein
VTDVGTDTTASRPAVTRPILCIVVAAALAALWATSYKNAKHPACTHGESSTAVSIDHRHVHIIRAPYATGCTP